MNALTVGELTRRIRDRLETEFRNVWVEGEVGAVKAAASGHIYLTLNDEQGSDRERAKIDAVIWRSNVRRLRVRPVVGQRVVVLGRVSVYPPRGGYQLVIDRVEDAGAGALEAALQALRAKLADEGLFDQARKQNLPFLPRTVGVVTSPTGAARRDIEAVIGRRCPNVSIALYPALVQGKGAAADVATGIAVLDARRDVEVIIVGRGGGSVEDLLAFNEEIVARAIAVCRTPVVSAVGHETDTTIADLVADVRAATPSAAAERVVPVRDELLHLLDSLADALQRRMIRRVEAGGERLGALRRELGTALRLDARRLAYQQAVDRLHRHAERAVAAERHRVADLRARLGEQHPRARLSRARQSLDRERARLAVYGPRAVERCRHGLGTAAARLEALSPLAILNRGYSITRTSTGQIVRAHHEVAHDDTIEILLHEGWLEGRVVGSGPQRR